MEDVRVELVLYVVDDLEEDEALGFDPVEVEPPVLELPEGAPLGEEPEEVELVDALSLFSLSEVSSNSSSSSSVNTFPSPILCLISLSDKSAKKFTSSLNLPPA